MARFNNNAIPVLMLNKIGENQYTQFIPYTKSNAVVVSDGDEPEYLNTRLTTTKEQITSLRDTVLYKTPQELTLEEANQVRINIHSVGQHTAGYTYTPYKVVETGVNTSEHTVTETPLDPVVAGEGAEMFNDYENNIATGFYSIATGYKTQAIGNYSRSNGWWTIAEGQCSNAEGLLSVASGHFSHAEGTRTKATTNNAHSEGDLTVASGRQSHAEGSETTASGFCAHSEGSKTKASGYYAHAEGLSTVASGRQSHAEGNGTIAAGQNQTAMGKFNISDTSSLLIIGKGSSDSARSNAFKVNSSGEGWFQGDVYVGSSSGTNKDSGSKKLATEEYVNNKKYTVLSSTEPDGSELVMGGMWLQPIK